MTEAQKARLAMRNCEWTGPTVYKVPGFVQTNLVVLPHGFEYAMAEIGRGWTKTQRPIRMELADSYGQFAEIHLCQSGVVR